MRAAFLCVTVPVLLSVLPGSATAQPTIPGRVVDDRSGVGIAARIEVIETKTALAADGDGRFVLDAAGAERLTLAVSHPRYYVHRVTIEVSAVASLEIRLVPIVTVADRIEVTASRAREGVDAASFTNVPQEKVAETQTPSASSSVISS